MQKYVTCFAAALFSFYDLFLLSVFNVFNVALRHHFHLSPESLGVLSSCFLWGNAIGLIPIGYLLDRGYLRPTAFVLLSLAILGTFAIGFSDSLYIAMGARFCQGLTSAASLLICMRMAIHYFKGKANVAIGWMISLALSGGIFGNLVYAILLKNTNFESAWEIAGIIGIFILGILVLYLQDIPRSLKPFSINFFSNPRNYLLGGYLGLINFPVFILGALWGNYYISHHYQVSLIQSSLISSLIFIGIIVGSPMWGYLANKINPGKIMIIGCIALSILGFTLYVASMNLLRIEIIFFCFGFFSCTQNMTYFFLSKINTPETLSSGTAIASVVFNSIGAVSQIIFYSAPFLFLFPLIAVTLLLVAL